MQTFKIIFYTPLENTENIKEAMFKAGGGHIGQYAKCAFTSVGEGQFLPLEGSQPHLGQQDQLEKVKEARVEMICPQDKLSDVLRAMKEAHPYEEVAYDVFERLNF